MRKVVLTILAVLVALTILAVVLLEVGGGGGLQRLWGG
jgi:preprotein translocase subunit SecG